MNTTRQSLEDLLKQDDEYAWSWHCNIAMNLLDNSSLSHRECNRLAALQMKMMFNIDTSLLQQYQDTQKNWTDEVKKDMFVDIYDRQVALNSSVTPWASPSIIASLDDKGKMEMARKYLDVLDVELGECKLATGVRWWKLEKDTAGGIEHLIEECIDMFHFLMCTFIVLGLGPNDIHRRYVHKNLINGTRPDWERNLELKK